MTTSSVKRDLLPPFPTPAMVSAAEEDNPDSKNVKIEGPESEQGTMANIEEPNMCGDESESESDFEDYESELIRKAWASELKVFEKTILRSNLSPVETPEFWAEFFRKQEASGEYKDEGEYKDDDW